jgi:hypothetical protein
MHDAGATFRSLFYVAALDGVTRSALLRQPGGSSDDLSERSLDARRRVAAALNALGGHDSAAGSCAWYIVGLEMSVREWAMRQGWGGRPVPPPQAQGMLVATLSVLAGHFGLAGRQRAASGASRLLPTHSASSDTRSGHRPRNGLSLRG